MSADVVTIGRVLVDLYPEQDGPLESVSLFRQFVGGSPTNVAIAASRLGRSAAVIGSVGDDPFGRVAQARLLEYGVDTSCIRIAEAAQTPVAFCEMVGEESRALIYRPEDSADRFLALDERGAQCAAEARVLWISGSSLATTAGRDVVGRARIAASGTVVLDLDYRPAYWRDREEARVALHAVLAGSHVVVGNMDECRLVVDADDPYEVARQLVDLGPDLAIVKMGERGVVAASRSATWREDPIPITARNGLGAGDAFGGALCHGLLSGWETEDMLHFASAAGALVAGRRECSAAMPGRDDVIQFLERNAHAA